jgi:heterodisulfide reductase subunit A-like polyferredoxin
MRAYCTSYIINSPHPPTSTSSVSEMVSQDFFDVIVIGGGMGGLSAATAAAEAGARVLLAEKGVNAGGSAIYVSDPPKGANTGR